MPKNKKVTLNNLKNIESKVYTKKQLIVDIEGNNFDIVIDEVFKDSSIEKAITDMGYLAQQCEENNININPFVLSNLVIIKHFTDINFPQDIVKQIEMFGLIVDLGVFEKIMEHIPESEAEKLNAKARKMSENLPKVIEMLKSEIDKQSKLANDVGDLSANI